MLSAFSRSAEWVPGPCCSWAGAVISRGSGLRADPARGCSHLFGVFHAQLQPWVTLGFLQVPERGHGVAVRGEREQQHGSGHWIPAPGLWPLPVPHTCPALLRDLCCHSPELWDLCDPISLELSPDHFSTTIGLPFICVCPLQLCGSLFPVLGMFSFFPQCGLNTKLLETFSFFKTLSDRQEGR